MKYLTSYLALLRYALSLFKSLLVFVFIGFAASAAQSDTPKEMVVLGLQVDQQFRQNLPAWSFNQFLSRQKASQNMLYSATYMETLPVAKGGKQWSCLAEALYFEALTAFVEKEYQTQNCYPKTGDIFAASELCAPDDIKVVLLGQDPYHGPNQAHGLCFSVPEGVKHPPSLVNIFKEIEQDEGIPYPDNGNLERWAKQGVLLLNVSLSVREGTPGSHQKKGWETFTNAVIKKMSEEKENLVFLLWGGFAKEKIKYIKILEKVELIKEIK